MKKRIFVALPLSQEIKDKISFWEKKIKNLPVRIIPSQNLHITIIPPWYEANIISIEERLESLQNQIGKITINFHKISFGPDFQKPRLIWIEGNTPSNLIALKKKIEKILPIEPEKKLFKTHVTIARFNSLDFQYFSVKKLEEKIDWEEQIESFVLMESKLLPSGAEYKILKTINL